MADRDTSLVRSHWVGIAGTLSFLVAVTVLTLLLPVGESGTTASNAATTMVDENVVLSVGIAAIMVLSFSLVMHSLLTLDLQHYRVVLPAIPVAFVAFLLAGFTLTTLLGAVLTTDLVAAGIATIVILAPFAVLVGTTRYAWHRLTT